MDLTVVVLSWNTAELTVRALASVREGAAGLRVRRICVDNASRDESVSRVRREQPEVLLLENPANLGFAAGNNRALPQLEGRYTCFLNSDCAASTGSLTHVVRWLDDHPGVGAAAPRLEGPDGRLQTAARPEPTPIALLHRYTVLRHTPLGRGAARRWRTAPDPSTPCDVASVTGACLFIQTDLLQELGGFDGGYPFYWEDVDLCRRVWDRGRRVAWVADGPAVVHEGGAATSVAGGPPRLPFVTGLLRYQRKHLSPVGGQAFAAVLVLGIVLRALVEPPQLAARALGAKLRGRPTSAQRRLAAARSWLRFLERDTGRVLRLLARPGRPPLRGRGPGIG